MNAGRLLKPSPTDFDMFAGKACASSEYADEAVDPSVCVEYIEALSISSTSSAMVCGGGVDFR